MLMYSQGGGSFLVCVCMCDGGELYGSWKKRLTSTSSRDSSLLVSSIGRIVPSHPKRATWEAFAVNGWTHVCPKSSGYPPPSTA
jgi:hypothetical protein